MTEKKVRVHREMNVEYEEALILTLDIRCWGATASMDVEKYGLDKKIVDAYQSILEDRSEIKQLNDLRSDIKNFVDNPFNSIKHRHRGLRIVFKRRVLFIDERLKEYEERFWRTVNRLADNLPEHEAYFAKNNPKYYRPEKYPTREQFFTAFSFFWQFENFSPPMDDGDNILSPAFYKEQERKAVEEARRYADDLVAIVGSGFMERIDSLRKQCFNDTINTATVDGLHEYLENFDAAFNGHVAHGALQGAIEKVKLYMDGTDAPMLRYDSDYRELVGSKMEEIMKGINLISDARLHRSIDI